MPVRFRGIDVLLGNIAKCKVVETIDRNDQHLELRDGHGGVATGRGDVLYLPFCGY
jgi:hypothetical protein